MASPVLSDKILDAWWAWLVTVGVCGVAVGGEIPRSARNDNPGAGNENYTLEGR